MNLSKKKKKKGFTLIELMAVIAIIVILAAVLVPNVKGYINRSKKTVIITQINNAVTAIEAHNLTSEKQILVDSDDIISTLSNSISSDLLSESNINKIQQMKVKDAYKLNKDKDAISKIKINSSGDFIGINEE